MQTNWIKSWPIAMDLINSGSDLGHFEKWFGFNIVTNTIVIGMIKSKQSTKE